MSCNLFKSSILTNASLMLLMLSIRAFSADYFALSSVFSVYVYVSLDVGMLVVEGFSVYLPSLFSLLLLASSNDSLIDYINESVNAFSCLSISSYLLVYSSSMHFVTSSTAFFNIPCCYSLAFSVFSFTLLNAPRTRSIIKLTILTYFSSALLP